MVLSHIEENSSLIIMHTFGLYNISTTLWKFYASNLKSLKFKYFFVHCKITVLYNIVMSIC